MGDCVPVYFWGISDSVGGNTGGSGRSLSRSLCGLVPLLIVMFIIKFRPIPFIIIYTVIQLVYKYTIYSDYHNYWLLYTQGDLFYWLLSSDESTLSGDICPQDDENYNFTSNF
jgi:hypothetical protein